MNPDIQKLQHAMEGVGYVADEAIATAVFMAREMRKRSPQALLAIVTGMDVRGQNRANLALVDAVFRKPIDVGALDDFLGQSESPSAGGGGGGGGGAGAAEATPPPS